MSTILEIIELSKRSGRASTTGDRNRRAGADPISESCRSLLDEAAALGLDFDDVIDAIRRCASSSNHSN